MKSVNKNTFFIAGGYGVVGSEITKLLIEKYPQAQVYCGGRNPDQSKSEQDSSDQIKKVAFDISQNHIPAEVMESDVIICATPDPNFLLAEYAIKNNKHYFNISVADSLILPLLHLSQFYKPSSSIVPLGYYESGLFLPLINKLKNDFLSIDSVLMLANNDPVDLLGPKSYEDLSDQFPSLIRQNGLWTKSTEPKTSLLFDSKKTESILFPLLDTTAAAAMTDAKTVRLDICSEQSIGSSEGKSPSMDIYVDMEGIDKNGQKRSKRIIASDPKGQAHMTALGVVLAIGSALDRQESGLILLENLWDLDMVLEEMIQNNIKLID